MQEKFEVCVDDDKVDIIDWIQSHFEDGGWYKNFEVTVTLREIEYVEESNALIRKYVTDSDSAN